MKLGRASAIIGVATLAATIAVEIYNMIDNHLTAKRALALSKDDRDAIEQARVAVLEMLDEGLYRGRETEAMKDFESLRKLYRAK